MGAVQNTQELMWDINVNQDTIWDTSDSTEQVANVDNGVSANTFAKMGAVQNTQELMWDINVNQDTIWDTSDSTEQVANVDNGVGLWESILQKRIHSIKPLWNEQSSSNGYSGFLDNAKLQHHSDLNKLCDFKTFNPKESAPTDAKIASHTRRSSNTIPLDARWLSGDGSRPISYFNSFRHSSNSAFETEAKPYLDLIGRTNECRGFKREAVHSALLTTKWNIDEAMVLLNGAPHHVNEPCVKPSPPSNDLNIWNNCGIKAPKPIQLSSNNIHANCPQSRKISGAKQLPMPFVGQTSAEQPTTMQDEELHALIKKIKLAVEAGYLDKRVLDQSLALPTLIMLNDFIAVTEQILLIYTFLDHGGVKSPQVSANLIMLKKQQQEYFKALHLDGNQIRPLTHQDHGFSTSNTQIPIRNAIGQVSTISTDIVPNYVGQNLQEHQNTYSRLHQFQLSATENSVASGTLPIWKPEGLISGPPVTQSSTTDVSWKVKQLTSMPVDVSGITSDLNNMSVSRPIDLPFYPTPVGCNDGFFDGVKSHSNPCLRSTWLLLKNLPANIDGPTLHDLCGLFGIVQRFRLKQKLGIALCKYTTLLAVDHAQLALNNYIIFNVPISVEIVNENSPIFYHLDETEMPPTYLPF